MQSSALRVSELAERIGGTAVGEGDPVLERVSGLADADERSLVFIADARHASRLEGSRAGCCITPPLDDGPPLPRIEAAQPKLAFARAAAILHPPRRRAPGVHPTAVVAPSARVDPSAHVGPHARIGEGTVVGEHSQILGGAHLGDGVRVGRECLVHPTAVLYDGVVLGDRVILHSGVVVGADGFGYVREADGYVKFPQLGGVVIGDDVEVGANTCIDRGALGTTRIGRGTKIDNMVMVAHNAQVGERVLMAGHSGVSGSSTLGNDVVMAGQSGVADHVTVGDGVQIGAKSAIFPGKRIPPGAVLMGIPARPLNEYKKINAHLSRLPALRAEMAELKQRMDQLASLLTPPPAGGA